MHIHILGICGTFMCGIAVIARQAGHRVTGCDAGVYPPMSTQLESQSIHFTEGFGVEQLNLNPDIYVVGNVITRGNPLMEEILNRGLPFMSGPQWLAENVLRTKWVLAVAGTHGKTSTSAMLAWILEYAGLHPGFLIGGIPQDFGLSARTTDSAFFVIEADEYDTAFFDKRPKFLHYHPKTAILNNLEFDHADIFSDLAAIEQQFHYFVRTIPGLGLIVVNAGDDALKRVLAKGYWTPMDYFTSDTGWQAKENSQGFSLYYQGEWQGVLRWSQPGNHNRLNALAALAAARHAGVRIQTGMAALERFRGVKRRMEIKGKVGGITVYDDFAHHPTAIQATIAGLRSQTDGERIVAVLEPRSNTMRMGVMKEALAGSLVQADKVFCYFPKTILWSVEDALAPLGARAQWHSDLDRLIAAIVKESRKGDHVLIMSNGGFGGIHGKLLDALKVAPHLQQ
jgi:UDP-N-acetylmuramate: L-alanyl-gamma-D-glutamyl-meso-diaminopimelate ligase